MAQEIYNEGRVVGLSAYEQYVKQAIELDPNSEPASEREWLASSLAMGSSMLLKITTFRDSGVHYRDIPLPPNSRLCAANTIIASFFDGDGNFSGNSEWADRVTDYGQLISNTSSSSPSGSNVPIKSLSGLSDTTVSKMLNYIKLADGIVIQPGTWTNTDADKNPPRKDLSPNLAEVPIVRLLFTGDITTEFNVLLTGFTNRVVVQGTSGIDTSTNTASPQDGDFLGPAAFPWSAKITFTTPSALTYYLQQNGIKAAEGQDEQEDGSNLPYDNVIVGEADSDGAKTIEVKKQISPAKGNVVIEPDNNEHQSEVSIDVKNKISGKTSGEDNDAHKYLDVSQTEDQSETSIKLTPKYMVKAGLGIYVSSDLLDGSLTISNQFPNYNDESNRVRVYPQVTGVNYMPDRPRYHLSCFNGWRTGCYNLTSYSTYKKGPFNVLNVEINPSVDADGIVACSISIGTATSYYLPEEYEVQGLGGEGDKDPAYSNTGQIFSATVMQPDIKNNVVLAHASNYTTEVGDDSHPLANCVIYRIRFYDGNSIKLQDALKSAATFGLKDARGDDAQIGSALNGGHKYKFISTTEGSAGIWNCYASSNSSANSWPAFSGNNYNSKGSPQGWSGHSFGGSWDVYCNITLATRNDINDASTSADHTNSKSFYKKYIEPSYIQEGDLYVRAVSIADGYNDQFYDNPYNSDDTRQICTWSSNLSVTGLIYRLPD